MKHSLAGLELLHGEYQTKLAAYHASAALAYYWTSYPEATCPFNHQPRIRTFPRAAWWWARGVYRERERRGHEVHRLHVDAYQAGELYRAALRDHFA